MDFGTILIIVAYYMNGEPAPNFFVVPKEQTCDSKLAVQYFNDFVKQTARPGYYFKDPDDDLVYLCLPVPPGKGPTPSTPPLPARKA